MTSRSRLSIVLLLGTLAQSALAQSAEERIERSRILVSLDRCRKTADPEEIVVCGNRRDPDRYRLPLRSEESQVSLYDRANNVGRASLDVPSEAPCGIFHGDRRCGKAEAALFGYGRGRDPLTVGAKVIEQLANPD
jgi:hypothetical protein